MKIKAILALLVSGTLFFGGLETAVAHTFVDETRLTLNVSDTHVHRNQKVTFSGRLIADHRSCYSHRTVRLYRNGQLVESTTTDSNGFYSFRVKVSRTRTYQVRFAGSVRGVHPHSHTCKPSRSRRATVQVNNGN